MATNEVAAEQAPEAAERVDTAKRLKLLAEKYASAQVQAELAYERDSGMAARKRYDEREKAAWAELVAAIDEVCARADAVVVMP
jgi:hypothetical protein